MKRSLVENPGRARDGRVRSIRTDEWIDLDPLRTGDECATQTNAVNGVWDWIEDGGIGDFLDPDTPATRSDFLDRYRAALSSYFPHAEVNVQIVPDKHGRTEFAWYEIEGGNVYSCWTEPDDEYADGGDTIPLYDIVSGLAEDALRATNRAAQTVCDRCATAVLILDSRR